MITYSLNGKKNFVSKPNNLDKFKEAILEEDMLTMKENEIMLFYDKDNNLINSNEELNNYTTSKDNIVFVKIQDKNEMKKNNRQKKEKENNDDIKSEPEIVDNKIEKQKKKDFDEPKEEIKNENKNEDIIKNSYINDEKEIKSNSNIPLIDIDLLVESISKLIDEKLKPLYDQLNEEKTKNGEKYKKLETQLNNSNANFNKSLENIDSKLNDIINNYNKSPKIDTNLGPDLQNINSIIKDINLSYQQEIKGVSDLIRNTTQSVNNFVSTKFKELKEKSPSNFQKIEESIDRCNKSLLQQFEKFKKDVNLLIGKENDDIIAEDENENNTQNLNSEIQNQYSGNQNQNSGRQNQYSGSQNQYSGNQNQYSGNQNQDSRRQNQYSGSQNKYSGNQNQFSGNQNQDSRRQNQYSGNQNQYSENQNLNYPSLDNNQSNNSRDTYRNLSNLNDEHEEKINQIKEFFPDKDENDIIRILKQHNWNVDSAIDYLCN